jgi:hypothetical protein
MSNQEMKDLDKELWGTETPYHKKPLGQIRADAKRIFNNPYRYVPEDMSPKEAMKGKGDYIGGEHYNRLPDLQQPAEIAHAWGLDFLLWNTVKYLSRAGHKEGTGMSNKEKEIDDLKKGIDYMRMRINVLQGRTPLDFGTKLQEDHEVVAPWLDEDTESFNKRWNPETMGEAREKYKEYKSNKDYYTQQAKAEGKPLGELDDDGIPL